MEKRVADVASGCQIVKDVEEEDAPGKGPGTEQRGTDQNIRKTEFLEQIVFFLVICFLQNSLIALIQYVWLVYDSARSFVKHI